MLILKIFLVEEIRGNLVTAIPPTIVTISKIKLVTIVERRDILKRECRNKKKQKKDDHKVPNKANMVEENSDIVAMVSNLHISMISELNMADAKSKSPNWWYDTRCITIHVCNNKSHFKNLEDATVEQQV
jgi:hypothetical protein